MLLLAYWGMEVIAFVSCSALARAKLVPAAEFDTFDTCRRLTSFGAERGICSTLLLRFGAGGCFPALLAFAFALR